MPETRALFDSCVVSAAFFQESLTRKAKTILREYEPITVDYARIETASVAWKRVRHGKEDPDIMLSALKTAHEFLNEACIVLPASDLVETAYRLALNLGITVYDALYLAAAMKMSCICITADKALYTAAHAHHPMILLTL